MTAIALQTPRRPDLTPPLGLLAYVALIAWAALHALGCATGRGVLDPCEKGAPRITTTAHWDGAEVSAVGHLCGDLSVWRRDLDGKKVRVVDSTWLCPGESWACTNAAGFDVIVRRSRIYAESQCDEAKPTRLYEMPPTKAHETCRVRLQLEPNGQQALVGMGPMPLAWSNR